MPFIPHTQKEIQQMLTTIGATDANELFDEIPESLRLQQEIDLPPALTEMEISRLMHERAAS